MHQPSYEEYGVLDDKFVAPESGKVKFMGWHQRFGEKLEDSDESRINEKPSVFFFCDSETNRAYPALYYCWFLMHSSLNRCTRRCELDKTE